MKTELLMDLLQVSELLKSGKKHHRKRERNHTNKEHQEMEKRKRKKMSFGTRMTLWLLLQEESLNQRTIAKKMNISAQAVSEIIKKLLEQDLIYREQGELNNENIITLTEQGKTLANRIDEKMNRLSEHMLKDFTEEELQTFRMLLQKMNDNKESLKEDMRDIDCKNRRKQNNTRFS